MSCQTKRLVIFSHKRSFRRFSCNLDIVVKIALDKATIHQENTYINKLNLTLVVTAKTATPTKVDSKLSDVHLESLERRKEEEGMPLRPGVESSAVGLHKRFYLASTRQSGMLFILLSSKCR